MVNQWLRDNRNIGGQMKPLNVCSVVTAACSLLRPSLLTKIEFVEHISEQCGEIIGDEAQIQQIVMNLCANAAQAMSHHGGVLGVEAKNVQLRAAAAFDDTELPAGDYVCLKISVTIPEIRTDPPGGRPDPFSPTKDVEKGSGTGLAVVNGMVQAHNGGIRIRRHSERGFEVECFLPCMAERTAHMPPGAGPDRLESKKRILYVDDEIAIVKMGKMRLERMGYTVETAINPLDALDLAKNAPHPFDLVITDWSMPQMTGGRLIEKLRRLYPGIKSIICSGYQEESDIENLRQQGVDCFLMKPVDKEELASTIRNIFHPPLPVLPDLTG